MEAGRITKHPVDITAEMQSKPCYITMLGGLHVREVDCQPVEFLPQQHSALLAYLALHLKRNPTREELAAQLLPEEEPDQAQRKMRHYLHELRCRFEQPPFEQANLLLTTRKTIRLNPDLVSTDVIAFEEALRAATRTTDLRERELYLARAVHLYQGDLLPGFYQECFVTERHRLSHLYEHALQTLTSVYEQLGDLEQAVEYARRAIALDPLKEEAHCSLMRLYAALGQPSAVVKQYQELERTLKEEFGEEPSSETRHLMETLRQSAQQRVPRAILEEPVPLDVSSAERESATSLYIPPAPASAPLPARPAPRPSRLLRLLIETILALLVFVGVLFLRHRPAAPVRSDGNVAEATRLWVVRYPPAPIPDEKLNSEPTAMTTDAAGNIYITGMVQTLHNDVDFLTLKYDPNGKLIWRARYNGPGNDVDRARSIAVDKEGNVYVTGDSDNGKGNGLTKLAGLDWATIKYDANGHQLWVARYNGPDDGEDRPAKVCVDAEGSVYVAGVSMAKRRVNGKTIPNPEWALVKYDSMGKQEWVRRERSATDFLSAEAVDMALDPIGNIYVTGNYATMLGVRAKRNLLTIKYSPLGDCLWRKIYSGKGFWEVTACRIALDGAGSVIITGAQYDGEPVNNGTRNDVVILKYDADGNQLWTPQVYDNARQDDTPNALAVDGAGNISIAGQTGVGSAEYLMLYYHPNGSLSWETIYKGTANADDHACGVAFDSAGNVIVTGYAQDAAAGRRSGPEAETILRGDNVTLKYDPAGRLLWKGVYGEGAGWSADDSLVAIDNRNNVIVCGQSDHGNHTPVITTIKYAPGAGTP